MEPINVKFNAALEHFDSVLLTKLSHLVKFSTTGKGKRFFLRINYFLGYQTKMSVQQRHRLLYCVKQYVRTRKKQGRAVPVVQVHDGRGHTIYKDGDPCVLE